MTRESTGSAGGPDPEATGPRPGSGRAFDGVSRLLAYPRPASRWLEALPAGNGRLGVMVEGGTWHETLHLNEESFWAGGPPADPPYRRESVEEVRRLVFAGRAAQAQELADRMLVGPPRRQQSYQPLGQLRLELPAHGTPAPEELFDTYRRELNLDTAIVTTAWGAGSGVMTREVFVSTAEGVLVVVLTAVSAREELRMRVRLASPFPTTFDGITGTYQGSWVGIPLEADGLRFAVGIAPGAGSSAIVHDTDVEVVGVGELTVLMDASTSFWGGDPSAICRERLATAGAIAVDELRARHVAGHRARYGRAELRLSGPQATQPFRGVDGGTQPADGTQFDSTLFDYGRYLLCCSSGRLPPTLQGIWNDRVDPPWGSKWTLNINLEMNYWPAEVTNLAETHEALADLVERLRPAGRISAARLYGCGGFVVHHNTDLWATTQPVDGARFGMWPLGAVWLCRHLVEHSAFSAEESDLAAVYPVVREAAEFVADFLVEDPRSGHLVTCPSMSPENAYIDADGHPVALCAAPTMDIWLIRELFTSCSHAAEALGTDTAFAARLRDLLTRLPTPRIGRHGQLQEWLEDYDEAEPGHRHLSHLYAIYPGGEVVDPASPVAEAARVSLTRRLAAAGAGPLPGWTLAWVTALWARLREGEKAFEALRRLERQALAPNLFGLHPPGLFQIDTNLGATAAIAEMLLQSHAGRVALLPALPAAWPEGRFAGFRARGGLEVDLSWQDSRAVACTLRTRRPGRFVLEPPPGQAVSYLEATGTLRAAGAELLETDVPHCWSLRLPGEGSYDLAFKEV